MGAEDAALVARLRRREPAAFDDVYALYQPRIFRFLLRLAGSRQLAEDLFQDTWLAAARHTGDLAEDTDLGAWLFTIARNKHRSHRRWAFLDFTQRERLAHEPAEPAPAPDRSAEARAEWSFRDPETRFTSQPTIGLIPSPAHALVNCSVPCMFP